MKMLPVDRRDKIRAAALGHRPGHASSLWKRRDKIGAGRKDRCKK